MTLRQWWKIPALSALAIGLVLQAAPASAEYQKTFQQHGKASYYARRLHGQKTASGEVLDNSRLVASHKTLPLGSRVRVTNLRNNRSVTVRITDRGPYARGRIIDLSQAAASQIGLLQAGVAQVQLVRLD